METKDLWGVHQCQSVDVLQILNDRSTFWDSVLFIEVEAGAEHRIREPHLNRISVMWSKFNLRDVALFDDKN